MKASTNQNRIPFEQWLIQFFSLAIETGYSARLMVLYMHYYGTVTNCLHASWEDGLSPEAELRYARKELKIFEQQHFKKYRECRNIKEKAEWFYSRWPTARSMNKKYPGRWVPYIGGIRIKDNLSNCNGYDSKEEAINVAEEFQACCGYIAYEMGMSEAIEQLAA